MHKYKFLLLVFIGLTSCSSSELETQKITEKQRWEQHAKNTEIIRDDFGVPHIYGKSNADAVFGLLYAQCEDDFNRVEQNYLTAIGRLAEADGKEYLYSDLRAQLYMTQEEAIEYYKNSPKWLKKLCIAFADGINFYLASHPEVTPRLITHFEPWMPMYFSEGSIGGDIERISESKLQSFYDSTASREVVSIINNHIPHEEKDPQGSNGFAIAGSRTKSGKTMLLINPHTSFFFRGEVHVVSEEGLNAYGAVTWGQFFVYQGFNEKTGWMHTSTGSDIVDEFEETIEKVENKYYYQYGDKSRAVDSTEVVLKYIEGDRLKSKSFTFYKTHHGPITHRNGEKWVATAIMWDPVKALEQSFVRTTKSNHQGFKEMMNIRTNSSNNTVYADADGNIAYYHGNFIPKRNVSFDYTQPVDGSNPKTDWQGLHTVDENIFVLNPATGWIQNCNSTPYSCAADDSPKQEDYPVYMTSFPENFRSIHAIDVLSKAEDLTLDNLITLAYDPKLPFAATIIPDLINAYEESPNQSLKPIIEIFQQWDYTTSKESISMTMLLYYLKTYEKLNGNMRYDLSMPEFTALISSEMTSDLKIEYLAYAMNWVASDFGSWRTPWGEINRYQRINGDIKQLFNDSLPSIPVGLAPGYWGALASYGANTYNGTKRQYGTYGNSFVAVVEFGDQVSAKSLLAGGQNSDPYSPHFDDQAQRYADCQFKTVAYYREDVLKRAKSQYRPGEENPRTTTSAQD